MTSVLNCIISFYDPDTKFTNSHIQASIKGIYPAHSFMNEAYQNVCKI